MIKSISFQKKFIPLIKSSKKTITRRVKFTGNPGDIFYFKVGRFGKKEGYIRILNVMGKYLHEIQGSSLEYNKEGFSGNYEKMFNEFKKLWNFLNNRKHNKKCYRWEANPLVYRIRFKYLGDNI